MNTTTSGHDAPRMAFGEEGDISETKAAKTVDSPPTSPQPQTTLESDAGSKQPQASQIGGSRTQAYSHAVDDTLGKVLVNAIETEAHSKKSESLHGTIDVPATGARSWFSGDSTLASAWEEEAKGLARSMLDLRSNFAFRKRLSTKSLAQLAEILSFDSKEMQLLLLHKASTTESTLTDGHDVQTKLLQLRSEREQVLRRHQELDLYFGHKHDTVLLQRSSDVLRRTDELLKQSTKLTPWGYQEWRKQCVELDEALAPHVEWSSINPDDPRYPEGSIPMIYADTIEPGSILKKIMGPNSRNTQAPIFLIYRPGQELPEGPLLVRL